MDSYWIPAFLNAESFLSYSSALHKPRPASCPISESKQISAKRGHRTWFEAVLPKLLTKENITRQYENATHNHSLRLLWSSEEATLTKKMFADNSSEKLSEPCFPSPLVNYKAYDDIDVCGKSKLAKSYCSKIQRESPSWTKLTEISSTHGTSIDSKASICKSTNSSFSSDSWFPTITPISCFSHTCPISNNSFKISPFNKTLSDSSSFKGHTSCSELVYDTISSTPSMTPSLNTEQKMEPRYPWFNYSFCPKRAFEEPEEYHIKWAPSSSAVEHWSEAGTWEHLLWIDGEKEMIINRMHITQPSYKWHNCCSQSRIDTKFHSVDGSRQIIPAYRPNNSVLSFDSGVLQSFSSTYPINMQKNQDIYHFSELFLQNSASDKTFDGPDGSLIVVNQPNISQEILNQEVFAPVEVITVDMEDGKSNMSEVYEVLRHDQIQNGGSSVLFSNPDVTVSIDNQISLLFDPSLITVDADNRVVYDCLADMESSHQELLYDVPEEFQAAESHIRNADRSNSISCARMSIFNSRSPLVPYLATNEALESTNKRSSIIFKKAQRNSNEDANLDSNIIRNSIQKKITGEYDDAPISPNRVSRSSLCLVHPPQRISLSRTADIFEIDDTFQHKETPECTQKTTVVSWATVDSTELSRGLHLVNPQASSATDAFDALDSSGPCISGDLSKPNQCSHTAADASSSSVSTSIRIPTRDRVWLVGQSFPITPSLHYCSLGQNTASSTDCTTTVTLDPSKFVNLMKRFAARRSKNRAGRFGPSCLFSVIRHQLSK